MENSYSLIELDNGRFYKIVEEVTIDEKKYVFLANENDNKDLLFQTINYDNPVPIISKIETEEEFNKVLTYFGRRYRRMNS